jgi:hypothetical protein
MIEGLRISQEIDPHRTWQDIAQHLGLPEMRRIVVAVDPSGAAGEFDLRADQIGLVVAGLGVDDRAYVFEDLTALYSPEGWGRAACEAFWRHKADRVLGEGNFGGDMVRAIVQAPLHPDTKRRVGTAVPVKLVAASRGKTVRAEPVAAMYERGKVHHVGRFPLLEDEMTNFTTAGYRGDRSPNRADALVWALTELFDGNMQFGLNDYYRDVQKQIDAEREERMKKGGNPTVAPAVSAPAPVAKLDVTPETGKSAGPRCPVCQSGCIQRVASGGFRCGQCGNQWGGREPMTGTMNRSTLLKV